jgi:2-methylisocitrate lyase-like PEP mutase family enzyme
MARTDANYTHGIKEAIERAQKFYELGADILFVEAPKSEDEMKLMFPGIENAVDNTEIINERCNVNFEFNTYHLPHFVEKKEDRWNE